MLIITILLSITCFIEARVLIHGFNDYYNNIEALGTIRNYKIKELDKVKGPLWVLPLDTENLDSLFLNGATYEQEDDFDMYVEPVIRFTKQHNTPVTTKKKHVAKENKLNTNMKNVKAEIMQILNKFTLYPTATPDVDISEFSNDDASTVSLYFKGPYAALIIKSQMKQWHYFISPPSPFPDWFHQNHGADNGIDSEQPKICVEIPDEIKNEFLNVLLQTVRKFFTIPV